MHAPTLTPAGKFRRLSPAMRVAAWLLGSVLASLAWCLLLLIAIRPGFEVFVEPARNPLAQNLYLAGTYVILLGGALWTWQRLQGESLRALGLHGEGAWQRVGLGLGLGLLSLAALFGLEAGTGLLAWQPAAWAETPGRAIAEVFFTAVFFAASEELLFRGFVFQTLRRGLDLPYAMAGSAWLYATVHFLRADVVWHRVALPFFGLFLAGLLLAWLALRTRSIWLGVGLHAGWVALFVLCDRFKLFDYPPATNWLTGGGYPLGGVLGVALLLVLWTGLARGLRAEA